MARIKLSTGIVNADIIKRNSKTVWLRLANGDEIKVKPNRILDGFVAEIKPEVTSPKKKSIWRRIKEYFCLPK